MKNKLLLPLLGAIALFATPALAQDTPTSKPQATAPYNTSIGFRASVAGPSGLTPEIRIKHFIRPQSALELQVGQWNYQGAYQASLHYLWQPQLLTSSRLRPYAGLGIGAVGSTKDRFGERQVMETHAVLLGSVGVEYAFRKLPLAVSLDYRYVVTGFNTHSFDAVNGSRASTFGIGLKYTLRK
ncbi:outer membrane beta-barrel protein [Pontibacter akesuensis]|uniref:Outer membrane protein beta-barrel domain-containing protein n=1 Tax=Pontibacter akesuensis TaxID=388950 RepID=A0A1I7HX87_9BACT|nr:outer membrane beta-barrel protein [Pontibacter akesuensis]GHA64020.1 hypothetical protein GCM10007389_15850 [Pontibacter akesuensis]SFU65345.1 Outer membrane protein beta-barrel domain-containing protein [Pontibacter akesuensis]